VDRGAPGCVRACLSFVFFTERYGEKAIFLVSSLVASVIVVAIMVWGAVPIYGAILFFVICTIVGCACRRRVDCVGGECHSRTSCACSSLVDKILVVVDC